MTKERITFWTGCHAMRHGDIIKASIAILEKLDVDVRSVGGPRYCCGTIKDMNSNAATIMAQGAAKRLADLGRDTVVSYCPSCQTHADDFISEISQTELEFGHFVTFLHNHRDKLAARLQNAVNRRVALHLHSGFQDKSPINKLVRDLLMLVPGLEVVDHTKIMPGIHCTSAMVNLPGMKADLKDSLRLLRSEHGVDDVITIFHSCHRALCVHDGLDGLRITNFVKILAISMGLACFDDLYRNWKTAGSEDQIRETVGDATIDKIGASTFERLILPELAKFD
jgi:Fe-S oxidoreductase